MRQWLVVASLFVVVAAGTQAQELRLPNKPGSLKVAVIGDSGQPGTGQTNIAKQMVAWRGRFPG